jgi:hypothetical protein
MVERGKVLKVFPPCELPIDAAFPSQDGAKAAADIVGLFDNVKAIDLRRSGGWFEQGAEHPDRSGFAGAVRTQ